MKKTVIGFIAIVIIVIAAPLFAQEDEVKFKFGAKAGWFFWSDEDLKGLGFDNNWLVGADATAWFENGIGVGVGVQYCKKTVDDINSSVRSIPLNADLFYKIPLENENAVYLGAGPSLMLLDVNSGVYSSTLNVEDKAWGFNTVAGFEMENFFIEGQYIWAKANLKGYYDMDKVQYGGFSAMAGYRF